MDFWIFISGDWQSKHWYCGTRITWNVLGQRLPLEISKLKKKCHWTTGNMSHQGESYCFLCTTVQFYMYWVQMLSIFHSTWGGGTLRSWPSAPVPRTCCSPRSCGSSWTCAGTCERLGPPRCSGRGTGAPGWGPPAPGSRRATGIRLVEEPSPPGSSAQGKKTQDEIKSKMHMTKDKRAAFHCLLASCFCLDVFFKKNIEECCKSTNTSYLTFFLDNFVLLLLTFVHKDHYFLLTYIGKTCLVLLCLKDTNFVKSNSPTTIVVVAWSGGIELYCCAVKYKTGPYFQERLFQSTLVSV